MSEEIIKKAIKSLGNDNDYLCLGDEVIIKRDKVRLFIMHYFTSTFSLCEEGCREKKLDEELSMIKKYTLELIDELNELRILK